MTPNAYGASVDYNSPTNSHARKQANAERERFGDAMQSMDYKRALASQMLLDRLERELFRARARLARKAGRPRSIP
jgi:hypothetical protein